MSAIDTVLRLLKSGDHVVAGRTCTAARTASSAACWRNTDWSSRRRYVECRQRAQCAEGDTKIVFLETPTNPMMTVTDLAASEVAHERDALVVVDNTFCSPYLRSRSSSARTSSCTRPRSS
jgi:cystathionine beta-lyase/cystathionine gamma-synthase